MSIKFLQLLFVIFFFFVLVGDSFAGGAAAVKKRSQGAIQRQQQIQQQIQLQQQQIIQQQIQLQQQQIQEQVQKQAIQKAVESRAQQQRGLRMHVQQQVPDISLEVQDVVDFDRLLKSFETSSRAWPLIIDMEAKVMIVSEFIKRYHNQKVNINKPSQHYAELIDSMVSSSPAMLNQPLEQILKIVAVIEYDFNNGQDKDALALKILGTREAVLQNKKRLGLK